MNRYVQQEILGQISEKKKKSSFQPIKLLKYTTFPINKYKTMFSRKEYNKKLVCVCVFVGGGGDMQNHVAF
jgi:hypothetical protein